MKKIIIIIAVLLSVSVVSAQQNKKISVLVTSTYAIAIFNEVIYEGSDYDIYFPAIVLAAMEQAYGKTIPGKKIAFTYRFISTSKRKSFSCIIKTTRENFIKLYSQKISYPEFMKDYVIIHIDEIK